MKAAHGVRLVEVGTEPRVFVFDINIWLDVATLLSPYPTPEMRNRLTTSVDARPSPDISQPEVDSYRCWLMAGSGVFAGPLAATLFISEYMLEVLYTKLIQPDTAVAMQDRGLGWERDEAEDFIEDAVLGVAQTPVDADHDEPSGAVLNPPLDHEDGRVLACALKVGAHYLVTRDRDFDRVRDHRSVRPTLTICRPGDVMSRIRKFERRFG